MELNNFSFSPLYKELYFKRNLLLEKTDNDDVWVDYVILDFSPYSKESSEVLAVCLDFNNLVNTSFVPEITKEYIYRFNVISNYGKTDGSEIIDWVQSFYNEKNKYYEQNIYHSNAKDVHVYVIHKNFKRRLKINLTSCIPKSPLFFHRRKNNKNQMSITLQAKSILNFENFN